jgi:predicted enzyme related to lactoylglutathione lyase
MLKNSRVSAALPTSDQDRAKNFYKEKLGLTPSREDEAGATYELGGGTEFLLFQSMGKPSGDHTQAGIVIDDIEATVSDLRSKGVEFQEIDAPEIKTENGIATFGTTKAAWFSDSEGNVIGLIQEG